jgi:hypothetical protein
MWTPKQHDSLKTASPDERRKLKALLSLQLPLAAKPELSLRELISNISQRAQERGLTEVQLQELLDVSNSPPQATGLDPKRSGGLVLRL